MSARHARRTTPVLATAVAAVLLVGGCSGDGSGDKDRSGSGSKPAAGAAEAAPAVPGAPGGKAAPNPAVDPAAGQRKVVLTGDLRIRVPDLDRATADAQAVARARGGLVTDERTTRSTDPDASRTDAATTTLTLKVPPTEFDRALDELSRIGKVVNRQRTAKDVTDEVVDVNSRVESQRRSMERTRQLMDRADTIADITTLESELTRREADLESLLKRQQALTAQTDLSTITVTIGSDPKQAAAEPKDDDDGFTGAVGDAWSAGWHGLAGTGRVIAIVLAAVFPFALILIAVWLLDRFTGRRLRRLRPLRRTRHPAPAWLGSTAPTPPAPPTPPIASARPEPSTPATREEPPEPRP
ncbi:DUF4349 domain-containing protein [Embleya sp. NBC_00888]|uniref:DUF4349 domain-containing protein n=1 Tax=Embleya sp. NBC_00888 TaxID=2975960 RepID=UPI003866FC5E|nr:DUF4349 domain-containing protein [Embleya sp. NBC_00888]